MITRRQVFGTAMASVMVAATVGVALAPRTWAAGDDFIPRRALEEIEQWSGGRLGVAVLDTGTGRTAEWRGDERFPLNSSFKVLLAAMVLARVDAGAETLERTVPIEASDLVSWAPAVEKKVGSTMTVAELCSAAVTLSDNAAANLLLETVGGPDDLTRFLRETGDQVTRLDRTEPTLNDTAPGDPRDTTSPRAMLSSLEHLLLGDRLSPASRQQLLDWMLANKTGDTRIRAGVPANWRVGDKTGTSGKGAISDVAILFPPDRKPVLLTIYIAEATRKTEELSALQAAVARIVAERIMAMGG